LCPMITNNVDTFPHQFLKVCLKMWFQRVLLKNNFYFLLKNILFYIFKLF
jgi:hypothetical protein